MKFWSKCREAIYVLRRRARLEGPTTVSLWAPVEEGVPDAWWSTCAPWGSSPFTGKPYHPTTQGKNERFGQALFRYLDQQPLAASTVIAIWDTSTITFADPYGEVLIQYTWPPQGTSYVSHHPPDPPTDAEAAAARDPNCHPCPKTSQDVRRRRGRESCPRTRRMAPPGVTRTRSRGMSPSALVAGQEMAGRPEKVRWRDGEGRRGETNRRDSPTARPQCGCPRR